jgi:hypothetical protein
MKRKQVIQREPHQKKCSSKGKKSLRNVPELYAQTKISANFTLTPFAKSSLNEHAKEYGLSMSEFLERLIRWIVNPAHSGQSAHAHEFIEKVPLQSSSSDR